jgi:hypothetical protein
MVLQVEPTQIKTMKSSDPFDETKQKRHLQCSSSWIDFGSPQKSTDAALSAAIQISKEAVQCYLPPQIHNLHMNMKLLDSTRSSQTVDTAPSSPQSSISSRKTFPKIILEKSGNIVLPTTPTSKRNYKCNSIALCLPLNPNTSTSSHDSHSPRASARVVQVQESSEERTATVPKRCFKGEPVEAAKRRLSAGAVEATRSASRLRERSSERRRHSVSAISRDKSLDRSSRSRRRDHQQLSRNTNMHQDESTEDEMNCFASPKTTTTPLDAWKLREQVKPAAHSIGTTPRTTEDSSKNIRVLEKTLAKEERRKARRAKKDADEEEPACTSTCTGFEVNYKYKKPGHKARSSATKSTCMVEAVEVHDCKQQEEQSKASRKQQKQEPQESSQSPVIPKTPTLAAWQLRELIKKLPTPIQARKRLVYKKEESPREEPFKQDTPPVKPQRKNTKEKELEERRKSRYSRTSVAQKELESNSQDELPSGFAVTLKKSRKADKPNDDQRKTAREERRKSRISTRVSAAKTELQSKLQDQLSSGLKQTLKNKTKNVESPKDENESKAKGEHRQSRTIRTSATKKEIETNPKDDLPSGAAGLRDTTNRCAPEKAPVYMTPATPRSSKWAKVRPSIIISTNKQAETTRKSRQDEPQSPKDEFEEGTGTRTHPFASVPQSPGIRRSQVAAWQLREQAKKKGSPGGLDRSSHHLAHRRVPPESPSTLPPAFRSILTTPRSAIQQRPNKNLTTKAAMEQQKSESAVRRSSILDSMSNLLEPHETDPQKMISEGKVEIINGKARIVFELGDAASLPEGTRIPWSPISFDD